MQVQYDIIDAVGSISLLQVFEDGFCIGIHFDKLPMEREIQNTWVHILPVYWQSFCQVGNLFI